MTPDRSRHRFALLMLVLACAGWGVSFPASKALAAVQSAATPGETSWFLVGMQGGPRFLIAGLLMAVVTRRALWTARAREIEQAMALTVSGCLGMIFQVDGLQFTTASTSAFLTQSYCLVLPVWHSVARRRLPTARELAAIGLILLGVTTLARVDLRTLRIGRGEWETLVSACFFTGQILSLENTRYRANRSSIVSTVMFLGTGLGLLALAAGANRRPEAFLQTLAQPFSYVLLALLVVVCTLGSFNLMNHFQPRVTAVEAGLIYTFEPLFASFFALFLPGLFGVVQAGLHYPNEVVTASLVVGGGLIVLANVTLHAGATTTPAPAPEPPKAGRNGPEHGPCAARNEA